MINLDNNNPVQNSINNISNQLLQSINNISSGNTLYDSSANPADYTISESLLTQLNGSQQAENNVENGMNLLNTAFGGMSAATNALETMNNLAIEAGNGTLNSADLSAINTEYQQMNAEVGDIAQNTEFNGTQLLNGTTSSVSLQSGAGAGNQTSSATGNITPENLGLAGTNTETQANSQSAISATENALENVSSQQAIIGAEQNGLTSTVANLGNSALNTASTLSQISGTNIESEVSNLTESKIKLKTSIYALLAENQQKGQILSLLA